MSASRPVSFELRFSFNQPVALELLKKRLDALRRDNQGKTGLCTALALVWNKIQYLSGSRESTDFKIELTAEELELINPKPVEGELSSEHFLQYLFHHLFYVVPN
jgi:hypothetical protein